MALAKSQNELSTDPSLLQYSPLRSFQIIIGVKSHSKTISSDYSVPDSGQATLQLANMQGMGDFTVQGNCQSNITLTRKAFGNLDPNYGEGGKIVAEQTRSVSINIEKINKPKRLKRRYQVCSDLM